jgi:RHS repeat-associated protein
VELTTRYEARVGLWEQGGLGLGGWSLSGHHVYDPASGVLYLGDGTRRTADSNGLESRLFAGNGTHGDTGDSGDARRAQLDSPDAVAVAADGTVYVADTLHHRIRAVKDGKISAFAGTGVQGHTGSDGPAKNAQLDSPTGMVVTHDGRVCFSELYADSVRCVGQDGVLRVLAGGGTTSPSTTPVKAKDASILRPAALALGPDGSIFVAVGDATILRITTSGLVELAAGSGTSTKDGIPARSAQLLAPQGLAVGADGTLYIADGSDYRVRAVSPSGTITTFAGTGTSGYFGDGGPATSAKLAGPAGIAVAPNGDVLISDGDHIRRVSRGRITSVAGGGTRGAPEGFAGAIASFTAKAVAVAPDGVVYVGDQGFASVLALRSPFPGVSQNELSIPSESGADVYVFDGAGRHLRTLDGLTSFVKQTFTYDPGGRLSIVSDAHGNALKIARDAGGLATTLTAPFGQVTKLEYDSHQYLARVTDSLGRVEQLTHDAGGLLTERRDAGGGVHTMKYDELGLLLSDATAENAVMTFASMGTADAPATKLVSGLGRTKNYAWVNNATSDETRTVVATDGTKTTWTTRRDGTIRVDWPTGVVEDVTLEADPRLGMLAPYRASQVTTLPSGLARTVTQTMSATFGATGALVSMDGTRVLAGDTSTSHYEAANRRWTWTSAEKRVTTMTLDVEGRVASFTPPGDTQQSTSYDARGRFSQSVVGARTSAVSYGGDGAAARYTDAMGRVTEITRDGALRPVAVKAPDGSVTSFAWNEIDALTKLTVPGGAAHRMGYGKDGQEGTYTSPLGGVEASGYDADRALSSKSWPDGTKETVTRDSAGRIASVESGSEKVQHGYDSAGRLASLSGPGSNKMQYTYDGTLLSGITFSGATSGTVGFAYDDAFRLKSTTVGGAESTLGYDADGLVTSATDTASGTTAFAFRDAQTGRIAELDVAPVSTTYGYSNFGELSSLKATSGGTSLLDVSYVRDVLGRITSKTENGVLWAYAYDTAGRLSEVRQGGAVVASYKYDPNGNRLSNGAMYDADDRLLSTSSATYKYDGRGALIQKDDAGKTTKYTWDGRGYLKSVALPSGSTVSYELDGLGRRVSRSKDGAVTARYVWRSQLQPEAEVDAAGSVVTRYIYARGDNAPDVMVRAGVAYALVKDHLGSIRAVVNLATGAAVQQLDYDAWGNILSDTSPGFQPFGFAGGLYDPDTGLTRFGEREYDPAVGRWTRRDPIRFDGGLNQYAYTNGEPVNATDSSGTMTLGQLVWDILSGNFEKHCNRNKHNSCPKHPPTTCPSERNDWNKDEGQWYLLGSTKWRSWTGYECDYDDNGNLLPDQNANYTYNYGTDPLSLQHIWNDVVPHYTHGGAGVYAPGLTQTYDCE